MEFEEGLAFPLASLAHGTPLTRTQLENIIGLFPEEQATPQTRAILRLLLIAERALASQNRFSVVDSLGLILQALVGKLKVEEPLRWLAACEFEKFREYCIELQDNELRSALQWSFGLYPPAHSQAGQPPIFLQKSGLSSGNPQWLFSRQALKEYMRIKGAKLGEAVREIFLFLLSDRGLLQAWSKDPVKLLWAELYLMYNHLILEPHLREAQIQQGNEAITWVQPTVSQTVGRLRQLEGGLQLEERVLLRLVLSILAGDGEWREAAGEGQLDAAFGAFLQSYNEAPQWQNLMTLLLFSRAAKACGQLPIAEQCAQQFKRLLAVPYFLEKLVPFLYFFLGEEEILQVIEANSLEYWRVPLPEELKQKAAHYLIERGVLHLRSLRYVSPESLLDYIFKSPAVLEDPAVGVQLMNSLQNWQPEVLAHVKHFGLGREEAAKNYRLFIELWSGYYRLLQEGGLELAEDALCSHAHFHPALSFLRLPSNSPNALLNILLHIARAYRAQENSHGDLPALRQQMQDFRENCLPPLLERLGVEQRAQFEREWGEMGREPVGRDFE